MGMATTSARRLEGLVIGFPAHLDAVVGVQPPLLEAFEDPHPRPVFGRDRSLWFHLDDTDDEEDSIPSWGSDSVDDVSWGSDSVDDVLEDPNMPALIRRRNRAPSWFRWFQPRQTYWADDARNTTPDQVILLIDEISHLVSPRSQPWGYPNFACFRLMQAHNSTEHAQFQRQLQEQLLRTLLLPDIKTGREYFRSFLNAFRSGFVNASMWFPPVATPRGMLHRARAKQNAPDGNTDATND
jgi:hypothetical protein